jgi:hypothetical protein
MRTPAPPESPTLSEWRRNPDLAAFFHPDGCPTVEAQILAQFEDSPGARAFWNELRDLAEIARLHDRTATLAREEEKLHEYMRQGDMLRQIHLQRRQEQHCELCGYRFNYEDDGKPKPEKAWCRFDKRHCDTNTGQDSCLEQQKAQVAATRRAHRKALKPTNTQGPVKIALHSNGTPNPH